MPKLFSLASNAPIRPISLRICGFQVHARSVAQGNALVGLLMEKMEFDEKKMEKSSTVQKIIRFCEDNYKEDISVESVACELGLSRSYVSHVFSKKFHMCFRDYINLLRLEQAKEILEKATSA